MLKFLAKRWPEIALAVGAGTLLFVGWGFFFDKSEFFWRSNTKTIRAFEDRGGGDSKAREMTVERTILPPRPKAGGLATITLRLLYGGEGEVLALGFEEILPAGWTFVDFAGGAEPELIPEPGQNELAFTWAAVPEFPVSFSYRARINADAGGMCQIDGTAKYRRDGPELTSVLTRTTLQVLPAPAAAEGPAGL